MKGLLRGWATLQLIVIPRLLCLGPDFKSPADVVDYDILAEAFSHQDAGLGGTGPGTSLRQTGAPHQQPVAAVSGSAPPPSSSTSNPFQNTVPIYDSQPVGGPLVHVPSPTFDYIPPHLVSLFVTDMGGYTPSYVYRLLSEFYDRNDYLLSKQMIIGQ